VTSAARNLKLRRSSLLMPPSLQRQSHKRHNYPIDLTSLKHLVSHRKGPWISYSKRIITTQAPAIHNHGIKSSLPQVPNPSMDQQRQREDRRRISQRSHGKPSPAYPLAPAAHLTHPRSSPSASSSSSTPPSSRTPPSTGQQSTSHSSTGYRLSAVRWA